MSISRPPSPNESIKSFGDDTTMKSLRFMTETININKMPDIDLSQYGTVSLEDQLTIRKRPVNTVSAVFKRCGPHGLEQATLLMGKYLLRCLDNKEIIDDGEEDLPEVPTPNLEAEYQLQQKQLDLPQLPVLPRSVIAKQEKTFEIAQNTERVASKDIKKTSTTIDDSDCELIEPSGQPKQDIPAWAQKCNS